MATSTKIGTVPTRAGAERRIARLREILDTHFLEFSFDAAPAGGSFDIVVTSTYEDLDVLARPAGQTEAEYIRDTILQTLVFDRL